MVARRIEPERRNIEVIPINSMPIWYGIGLPDETKKPVGYVLITVEFEPSIIEGAPEKKVAVIWHIYVEEDYRRRGLASNLINALKVHYDKIRTHGITKEGRKLCLRNEFVMKKAMFKKDLDELIWTKG